MKLPDGVHYRPRQVRLIARDEPAIIQIETDDRYAGNKKYDIEDHDFDKAIAAYLRGDWKDFHQDFQLNSERESRIGGEQYLSPVIYSSAKHCGDPRLPNITVLPNLSTKKTRPDTGIWKVFGCAMGHYHPGADKDLRVHAVYEFQSEGMLALDCEAGEVELWVAQAGDKVAIPAGCYTTLYNLGDEDSPLITLDFVLPNSNGLSPDRMSWPGPILLACYDDSEVDFTLNRPSAESKLRVRIDRGSRLGLGSFLYEQLTQNPDVIRQFSRLGIHIKIASPEAMLEPLPPKGSRLYFRQPLTEATKRGTEVYRYFFPDTKESQAGPPRGKGITATEEQYTAEKESLIELPALNRALFVVVEGSGDWVEKAYRPVFEKKVREGKSVSVFYADDTRWKPRPEWADELHLWETYLDKADSLDFAIYQNLRPDVVFIVTPDFTHSAIARWWLGKTPLAFVEKPFDSHLDNVEALLREMGRKRGTAVLGLDHYQLYALPIHDLKSRVVDHLGGALARSVFYMTEERPIESGRERSLQHGLTLDLLPHFLALLTYFGDVGTIDEICIIEAGQYDPLIAAGPEPDDQRDLSRWFRNETYSRLKFTFQDYSGNGHHIDCVAVVGKGLSRGVKYMEITGRSGNAIRVELGQKPSSGDSSDYFWDSLFFIQGDQSQVPSGAEVRDIPDPHDPGRTLRIIHDSDDPARFCQRLERSRYEKIVDDLINGTRLAVASTLLLEETPEIVRALDRIWWAIQASKDYWIPYNLGELDPVKA